MPRRSVPALAAVLALSPALAFATLTPVGEFTGNVHEGFERLLPPNAYFSLPGTFQGTSEMTNTFPGPPLIIAQNFFRPIYDDQNVIIDIVEVLPYNGNLFGAVTTGTAAFTFNTPMVQIGGYFSTIGPSKTLLANFYDASNNLVGTATEAIEEADWLWFGWHSSVPFVRVEFTDIMFPCAPVFPFGPPGDGLTFDDMQAFSADAYAIPGDYNGDGFVDSADYTVWADHFGQTGSGIPGDGNGDGFVDSADYTVWADHFGQGTPPPGGVAIPEPASAALLLASLPLVMRHRARR